MTKLKLWPWKMIKFSTIISLPLLNRGINKIGNGNMLENK